MKLAKGLGRSGIYLQISNENTDGTTLFLSLLWPLPQKKCFYMVPVKLYPLWAV
jgi:hypothetical protein